MVNPGHPSGACIVCKARRVRCDEGRPSCSRCMKSKRACLGYSLQQSSKVQLIKKPLSAASPSTLSVPLFYLRHEPGKHTARFRVSNATVHFMKQFVYGSKSCTISPAYLGGLKSVLSQQTSDRALVSVFDAISTGFASLHEMVQTNEARRVYRYKYIIAMSELREALSSCSAAKFLPTVVLLFALYEVRLPYSE